MGVRRSRRRGARTRRAARPELDQPERPIGKDLAHQRRRDVVDGNVVARASLGRAVMGVSVEHGADGEARDRILETAAAEERIDVERLALDGAPGSARSGAARRVRSLRRRASADSSFSASSTASWTNFLMMSSPHGPSARRPNPPAKPLMPAKPIPSISVVSPSSVTMPASVEDLDDLPLLAGFEVVIAEDGDDRDLERRDELLDEGARLFGEAVVGQVAAQGQDVGRVVDLRKERLQGAGRRGAAVVQIAERGDTDDVLRRHARADESKRTAAAGRSRTSRLDVSRSCSSRALIACSSIALWAGRVARARSVTARLRASSRRDAAREPGLFLGASASRSAELAARRLLLLELDHLRFEPTCHPSPASTSAPSSYNIETHAIFFTDECPGLGAGRLPAAGGVQPQSAARPAGRPAPQPAPAPAAAATRTIQDARRSSCSATA